MMVTLDDDEEPMGTPRKPARMAGLGLSGFAATIGFSIVLAGIVSLVTKGEVTGKMGATFLVGLALLGGGIYALRRLDVFAAWRGPVSPKIRRARIAMVASGLIGGVIGVALSLGDREFSAFSNGPIDPLVAVLVTLAYLICTPAMAIMWHRNADEFDQSANARGALLGIYAYSFIAPSWWLLSRAGLLPQQDPMIVFLIVLGVWGAAWWIKKSD